MEPLTKHQHKMKAEELLKRAEEFYDSDDVIVTGYKPVELLLQMAAIHERLSQR